MASWLCRVRVCVRNETGTVVREGTGSGTGFGYNLGEAHESALKEAESDAMKRALVTFGSQFGLALYDKRRAEVAAPQEMATASQRRQISNLLGKTAVPREQWGELIEDLSGRDGLRSGDVASVASKLQGMIDGEDVEDVEPEPQESRAQAKKWIGDAVALESRDARIDFFRYLEEGGAGSRIKRLVAAVFKSAEGADYDPGDMAAAESLIGIPIADRSEAAS